MNKRSFLKTIRNLSLAPLIIPTKQINYISNEGWGVKPAEGEQCWININCVEEDSYLSEQKAYGYIIYELVDF